MGLYRNTGNQSGPEWLAVPPAHAVCFSNVIPFVNLWQAVQQQPESTEWVKLGLLGWPVVPNWSPVFEHGQQPGDWSRGPAALSTWSRLCLQPSASAPSHLFVCFPAFVWTRDFLCKLKETRSLWRKNPLPNCLNEPQCGFISSLCGSNVPTTNNYHISQIELQGDMCMNGICFLGRHSFYL